MPISKPFFVKLFPSIAKYYHGVYIETVTPLGDIPKPGIRDVLKSVIADGYYRLAVTSE
jgi:hypothetical protein